MPLRGVTLPVSCFAGLVVEKKTAWTTRNSFKEATNVFLLLSDSPCQVTVAFTETIERFVVLLYNRTSTKSEVNQARQQLFEQRRSLDVIPPTQAALVQHTKRVAYRSSRSLLGTAKAISAPTALSNCKRLGMVSRCQWLATTLDNSPEVASSCRELVEWVCKKECSGDYSWVESALKCTALYCVLVVKSANSVIESKEM